MNFIAAWIKSKNLSTHAFIVAAVGLVRTQIAECNRYIEIGTLSLYEMSEIAWIVEARGKQIGFLSPEELARRQQNPAQVPGPSIGFK